MERLPTSDCRTGKKFTIADFLEAGAERLRLSVVVGGEGLSRQIEEPTANRPGLALTGFFDYFAWKRLQLFGNAETAYLRSLSDADRLARIRSLFDHGAFCVIYTNGHKPRRDEIAVAKERGVVVLLSSLKTRELLHNSAFVLERLGAPRASVYGTMIEVFGIGVLFEGDPGMGKSETALGLIKRGHALVADDCTCLRKDVATDTLYGSASESTAGYMGGQGGAEAPVQETARRGRPVHGAARERGPRSRQPRRDGSPALQAPQRGAQPRQQTLRAAAPARERRKQEALTKGDANGR